MMERPPRGGEEHPVQHVVSALTSASSSSRSVLRLVPHQSEHPRSEATASAADDLPGRERETRLVDQSRDAHFAVRRRLRELASELAGTGLELLYDRARRVDEQLAGLYQARAAILAHRLGRLADADHAAHGVATAAATAHETDATHETPTSVPRTTHELSIEERALITRLRAASGRDRRTLLHLAVRFSDAARATQR